MITIPFKINQREKNFIVLGGVIAAVILIYSLVTWYFNTKATAVEYITAKRTLLEKQLVKISQREMLHVRLNDYKAEMKILESGLLNGDKPPVAAAEIQRILNEMTSSLNVKINTEKALTPMEGDLYIGIPVEMGFSASTAKLRDLLYSLKTSPLLLVVSELKVRVMNISKPDEIFATLVVTGFMNKPQKEDNKKQ